MLNISGQFVKSSVVHRVPSPKGNVGREDFTKVGHVALEFAAINPGEVFVLLKKKGNV